MDDRLLVARQRHSRVESPDVRDDRRVFAAAILEGNHPFHGGKVAVLDADAANREARAWDR